MKVAAKFDNPGVRNMLFELVLQMLGTLLIFALHFIPSFATDTPRSSFSN